MWLQFKRDLANGGLPVNDAWTSDAWRSYSVNTIVCPLENLFNTSLRFILNQNLIYDFLLPQVDRGD